MAVLKGWFMLTLVLIDGFWSATVVNCGELNRTFPSSGDEIGPFKSNRLLSRKKRFLLFPPSAQLLLTVSALKGLIFKAPGGNVLVAELDMFHPLPDYRYRISSLRLGTIAMLPTAPPKVVPPPPLPPPPPPPPPTPPPAQTSMGSHNGHEVSPEELKQYLKEHPDTYVPPGYGKDRSDWFKPGTYNPYVDPGERNISKRPKYTYIRNYYNAPNHQPYKSKLWNYDPEYPYQESYLRSSRSISDENAYELEEEEDRFNISHHKEWEHFYHYRERRELYHTLENEVGSKLNFPMKSCIMRAICEARNLLPRKGKSMMMDIARILFSVPLKADLEDDYSEEMRNQEKDCHKSYGNDCPISILYLMLFGKFTP
ncbi:uncharacterized protein LOC128739870 [Sabethes cyaneus]|uniref:uncharacterized protein LOC128739870 n=1 Tax=Sabethes cyaneus TaxID=53552 RepID=UPI00237DCF90|nr:uncharacterized protein LOC128739870 [Sabethes cyaneus]